MGHRVVLLGTNGAGKSSLIDCVCRIGEVAQSEYPAAGCSETAAMQYVHDQLRCKNPTFEQLCASSREELAELQISWERRGDFDVADDIVRKDDECLNRLLAIKSTGDYDIKGSFLLPIGNVNHQSTTIASTELRRGLLYEVVIEFVDMEEIVDKITSYWTSYATTNDAPDGMRDYYETLTNVVIQGFSRPRQKAIDRPVDKEDLRQRLHPDIKKHLGLRLVRSGVGGDIQRDRLYVHYHLNEFMRKQHLAGIIRRMVVYVPCLLLKAGAAIVDLPGTNDRTPIPSSTTT